jgi:hypothetical protein
MAVVADGSVVLEAALGAMVLCAIGAVPVRAASKKIPLITAFAPARRVT